MQVICQRLGSSVGLKFLVGLTGLGLLGFVVSHLLGNLLVFQGPEALNQYAKGLRELPLGLLNALRAGLLGVFLVHVIGAIKLTATNKAARPSPYRYKATIQATFASRTMIYSGLLILTFVLYHLAHYTWHLFGEVPYLASGDVDVYRMVVLGFSEPVICVTYIVAMLVLGLHLSHGISSFFQTVGWRHPLWQSLITKAGVALAWLISAGFISMPVAVWLEIVK